MQLTDRQVHDVIRDLAERDGRVSGAAVRAELARRHGARGGVARIYRLLAQGRAEAVGVEAAAQHARIRELEAALAAMTARAELAEYREVAHQDRTALEIHTLRQQLSLAQQGRREQGVSHSDYLRLYKEVIQLRREVADLRGDAGTPG
jgi:hypothetical protein